MSKHKIRVEWELFMDVSNFDMWTVRPKNDKDFNSHHSFRFVNKEDAERFKELI